ncbi:hypothetical protein EMGBD4_16130 [Verrucomicrobiota bacterium]|nr:hypothetical protein EMGBD4_16130 [Verrucomicrobiota bacterium]
MTVEDVDEQLSELRNQALIEGRDIHPLEEITDILEFVPQGPEVRVRMTTMRSRGPLRGCRRRPARPPRVEDVDKDMAKDLRWDDE